MTVVFFLLNSAFLFSLLLVSSNKTLLLASLVYLIILLRKTQNYRLSLFLLFINLLPFTIGRNLIDTTLIGRNEIFSFAIYDVKYFLPVYLSDLFLVLIYQNYFSKKFFDKKTTELKNYKLSLTNKIALTSLIFFFLLILLRSLSHEFSSLLLAGSLIILKFILVFSLPYLIDLKNKKYFNYLLSTLASMTFFHSAMVFYEQFKGGNLGRFIENRLPGIEFGTRSSEAADLLRADGTFNEPNITAIFLLINFMILFSIGIQQFIKNRKTAYLYLSVSLLALIAIIFTGSRSLYLLSGIGLIFYFLKYKQIIWQITKKIFQKKIFQIFLALAILLALPYVLIRTSSLQNVLSRDGSLSYRQELNQHVLSMSFKNYLGIGLDLTPYYLAKNFKTVDNPLVIFDQAPAHNILVQLLAETGIVATIVFLIFVYQTIKNGWKGQNQIFALAALAYFLAAQFHPVFTNHYELTAFFFLYLGIANYET